jgi:D-Tyr-tRNAtyr deacylase
VSRNGHLIEAPCSPFTGGHQRGGGTAPPTAPQSHHRFWQVPQASLAGKMKKKKMQYHSACGKALGAQLYAQFVTAVTAAMGDGAVVRAGTYGNRQALRLTSACGPMTHFLEL